MVDYGITFAVGMISGVILYVLGFKAGVNTVYRVKEDNPFMEKPVSIEQENTE